MSKDGRTAPTSSTEPARLVYVVDPRWGEPLVPALRDHFEDEDQVAVVVERRSGGDPAPAPDPPRASQRAPVAERDAARALPPGLRDQARHLRLVQPLAAVGPSLQDATLPELIEKTLALDPAASSELWWRIAPRVLARLELLIGESADSRVAGQVLGRILDELPAYDEAGDGLDAWLDALVDDYAREA